MQIFSWRSFVAWPLAMAISAATFAADTGTISGAVFDQYGQPVAVAIVSLTGDQLPVGRVAETGSNGSYRFEYVPPGVYAVVADKEGTGSSRRTVIVEVGKDTQVDLAVGLTVKEDLTVTAASPVVDVRSTEVSFNFSADAIAALPIERTYRGLFQLIPGVADNRSAVGPAAGGDRQDNTYLIDGANITNPSFGYLGTEINELDIAEVNLKRGAVSAEFGRASGIVTNAVSRSGSNRVSGIARVDWLPTALVSAYRLPGDLLAAGIKPGAFRDPLLTTERTPAVGIGGPIVRNRVFFYGSARYFRESKWDRVNKVGDLLPDEIRTGSEFYGKVTAGPSSADLLTLSLRERPNHVDHAGITSDFAPSVASTTDNGSHVATVEWSNFKSARRTINAKYIHVREANEDVPITALGYLPPFDPQNLSAMGQYVDPAQANLNVGASQYTNIQNYRRHEIRATVSQLFDVGATSHSLKAGWGYDFGDETYSRIANGWGSIASVTDNGVPALRTRYYTRQAPQVGRGLTHAVFVQDDVTVLKNTSVNLGLLINRDEYSQRLPGSQGCPANIPLKGGAAVYESKGDVCSFLRFGFRDEIQPRLGVSHQLRESKGDKLYANWGRYYNMDQKSSGRSLAPNRIFQTQTVFDLSGNILSSGPLASTTGKLIDPAIKPIYTDEVVVGYGTPLTDVYSLDVFFMSRELHNPIEDVPSRMNGTSPTSGPYVAANLPCTAFVACSAANARRTYRSIAVDIRRRLAGKLMSDVSYTWSRFEGNFDRDYSSIASRASVFNMSSFIQDGPGTNVEDPNRFGPLFEDRPHLFKAFASYSATARITVSGYVRVQSGTPWAARGRDWPGAVLNYLEPAGSHRNPVWANLDIMGGYRLPLGGSADISLEARLLNAFNNQTRLSTDAQQYLDLRMTQTAPYFAPYLQPNPFFATGNAFAPPRRLQLAATMRF
jgi:hypothetical protein